VNQTTGDVWVTNTASATVLRYPKYDTLQFNPAATGGVNAASLTIAVAAGSVRQPGGGRCFPIG